MEILRSYGNDKLAKVHVGRLTDGCLVEFAESLQPPLPRSSKWVLIVSTLRGCPVGCPICDAGGNYSGTLSSDEILAQISAMVESRYPSRKVPAQKFKVQFARMGDPAFNDSVLDVLQRLPHEYDAPGLMPCISTIAPAGRDSFFVRLTDIKNRLYLYGAFQMQFSIHTSDEEARRTLVPCRSWSFEQMAEWGRAFYTEGDRKIALNFAPVNGFPLDANALARCFDPAIFLVKLTPVNPTASSVAHGYTGRIDPADTTTAESIRESFVRAGFDTIVSIGETEENRIGSNCGMYVSALKRQEIENFTR